MLGGSFVGFRKLLFSCRRQSFCFLRQIFLDKSGRGPRLKTRCYRLDLRKTDGAAQEKFLAVRVKKCLSVFCSVAPSKVVISQSSVARILIWKFWLFVLSRAGPELEIFNGVGHANSLCRTGSNMFRVALVVEFSSQFLRSEIGTSQSSRSRYFLMSRQSRRFF